MSEINIKSCERTSNREAVQAVAEWISGNIVVGKYEESRVVIVNEKEFYEH